MAWTTKSFIEGKRHEVYALVHDGQCDFEAFLNHCQQSNPKGYAMMLALLERIAVSGPPNNTQKFRRVEDNLYEIKVIGDRLFCFFDPHSQRMIIVTHGWKKAHKLEQQREINRAKRDRDAYLNNR